MGVRDDWYDTYLLGVFDVFESQSNSNFPPAVMNTLDDCYVIASPAFKAHGWKQAGKSKEITDFKGSL